LLLHPRSAPPAAPYVATCSRRSLLAVGVLHRGRGAIPREPLSGKHSQAIRGPAGVIQHMCLDNTDKGRKRSPKSREHSGKRKLAASRHCCSRLRGRRYARSPRRRPAVSSHTAAGTSSRRSALYENLGKATRFTPRSRAASLVSGCVARSPAKSPGAWPKRRWCVSKLGTTWLSSLGLPPKTG
jgi:hypothetical protein